MTESKHTPGPWQAEDAWNVHSGKIVVRDVATGEQVAQVWGGNEEALANARLTAAAPELLEALHLASNKFAFAAGLSDPTNKNMFLQGAKAFCDAAIAKAEGRT